MANNRYTRTAKIIKRLTKQLINLTSKLSKKSNINSNIFRRKTNRNKTKYRTNQFIKFKII